MPILCATFSLAEPCKQNSKLTMPLLVLVAICLFGRGAEAQYGGGSNTMASAETSTYVFVPDQSAVVQTGGIAGVHETYSIEGQFRLIIDFDTGMASFDQVDANLVDESPFLPTQSLGELFNMAALIGNVVDETTIEFEGKTADGTNTDILLRLTFRDDLAHLTGRTVPPPHSADFFIFELDAVARKKYGGGMGEPNDPYRIATAEDLILLGDSPEDYDKHFILTADIDLDPNLPGCKVFDKAVIAPDTDPTDRWSEFQGTPFTGVFDGNSHMISHLTISGVNFLGLFGQLGSAAKISNLGLEAVEINGADNLVGGLVGDNSGSIVTSYSTGTVSGRQFVGGLVGWNVDGSIIASNSTGTVSGRQFVGGLVGWNVDGSIIASYSTGRAAGDRSVGGLVGWNTGSIAMSYSAGTASGGHYVGGLVGRNWDSITASYSTGTVTGNTHVGGLVGENISSITSSFWDMETSGQTTSAGGTGLTTTEMQDINTYLNAGWDFVDEILNGTCNYWQISPGDYPRLRCHAGDSPVMPEGLGNSEQPYLIRDAGELGAVWLEPTAHYRLEASVDLSGITWSMAVVPWFEGTFDGSGHTISHLTIRGGSYLGLFGQLSEGANVSNLGLEAVDVNGIGNSIGGLVGYNRGSIATSHSTGTVTGNSNVGGLVGESYDGSIATSYSTGTVTGDRRIGGLVGFNAGADYGNGSSITTSYSTGTVSGGQCVGGLVGDNLSSITSSYSTGTVTGDGPVGGLVGFNSGGNRGHGSITASYSMGMVTGSEGIGGLVGWNAGSITTSYSTGTVAGDGDVGGLVGLHVGNITASFWDVETSGRSTSSGGTGLTTAKMQDVDIFLSEGWDLVGEILNGTCDYWQISPGDYPRLRYHIGNSPVMPEGLGTAREPYLIRDARDLGTVWSKPLAHYCLEASLDVSGITWSMAVVPWFGGSFDGNGHVIDNLHIQGGAYLGLFGQLDSGAKVSNLGLEAVDVNGTGDYVSGLAGHNSGSITTCYSTGTVSGDKFVGGFVGENFDGSIATSYSTGTVRGDKIVGGLVGESYDGSIATSYSTGTVTGDRRIGGLVGWNTGSITASYSTGTVAGDSEVGGLVGFNNVGSIATSYSTGTISGNEYVGGFVGSNWGRIATSYSTGTVSGSVAVGGLVGDNDYGSVTSSFWDVETSGQNFSAGGTGKTTAEMQTADTFLEAGWDFVDETANGTEDIWSICEGTNYPRLPWQIPAGDFVCPEGITIDDFLFFIEHWEDDNCDLSNDYCDGTDLDMSGTVDANDLEILVDNWLANVRSD